MGSQICTHVHTPDTWSGCFSFPEGAWIKQEFSDLVRSSERHRVFLQSSLQQWRCVRATVSVSGLTGAWKLTAPTIHSLLLTCLCKHAQCRHPCVYTRTHTHYAAYHPFYAPIYLLTEDIHNRFHCAAVVVCCFFLDERRMSYYQFSCLVI